jgi:chromosome segregation ATPase
MTPEQMPLTKQDLLEALHAAIQPLVARLDTTDSRLDAAVQTLIARQEASMEALTHNMTDLRRELMDYLRRIENRTDRTDINITALLMQIGGMSKSLSVLERSDTQTAITQAAPTEGH